MIPTHAAAKLADLRQTAETLDYLACEGQVGEGEACVLGQMAKAIRADAEALELELWRSEKPADGCRQNGQISFTDHDRRARSPPAMSEPMP